MLNVCRPNHTPANSVPTIGVCSCSMFNIILVAYVEQANACLTLGHLNTDDLNMRFRFNDAETTNKIWIFAHTAFLHGHKPNKFQNHKKRERERQHNVYIVESARVHSAHNLKRMWKGFPVIVRKFERSTINKNPSTEVFLHLAINSFPPNLACRCRFQKFCDDLSRFLIRIKIILSRR